jgi:hypothetical protein
VSRTAGTGVILLSGVAPIGSARIWLAKLYKSYSKCHAER